MNLFLMICLVKRKINKYVKRIIVTVSLRYFTLLTDLFAFDAETTVETLADTTDSITAKGRSERRTR